MLDPKTMKYTVSGVALPAASRLVRAAGEPTLFDFDRLLRAVPYADQ